MNVTQFARSARALSLAQARPFSVAYNLKSKFEVAYNQKMEGMSKIP